MSESNYKYTSDGRKVVVIGALNAKQHIVQEIFVSGDQEIPSGENFVVSSLHDAPVESWKEKRLRDLEETYERRRAELERRIDSANRALTEATAKAKVRADALLAFAKNSDDAQLQRLYAFVAGEITHFFVNGYTPEIVTWDQPLLYHDGYFSSGKIEAIKLVSLVGKSDGDLSYRLGRYSDGSGGEGAEIVPCRSYDEALAAAQDELNARAAEYVSGDRRSLDLKAWREIKGIRIPEDALAKYEAEARQSREKRIATLRDQIAKIEAEG